MRSRLSLAALLWMVLPASAGAVTSSRSVPSTFGANGHNISFDGRILLARDSYGWVARVLRPEAITYLGDGLPDAQGPMWSESFLTLTADDPATLNENALSFCEIDHGRAPYSCNDAGEALEGGAFDCYDFWIFDSDAVTPVVDGGFAMRRRHLLLWVGSPRSPEAYVHGVSWDSGLEPLTPVLRGIEPTLTADGRLMVWQGHPDNDGNGDTLMYSVNANPCAADGWSSPQPITHMAFDPAILGTYRLGDRALRTTDGTVFEDGAIFHGAYPWLMANGDGIIYDATPMPCRAENDPPGCGPRRNTTSVIGYPTNWSVAHIDGGINPDTDQTNRLFFSSPGPDTLAGMPVTPGQDVWPFFGSNTSNYIEPNFDDGLDGHYAGFWHLNQGITMEGELDLAQAPDVSGYFNSGTLEGGLAFPTHNDGIVGRALTFDGVDDRVEVPHAASLAPVNGITLDFWVRPGAEPDCDGNNNWRQVLGKGDINTGAFTVVLEEDRSLRVRFGVSGQDPEPWILTTPVALEAWTHVSCEYDGPTGAAGCWLDDVEVTRAELPTGTLVSTRDPLLIGAAGPSVACPAGSGAFAGMIDEVAVSRRARRLFSGLEEPEPDPEPEPGADAGVVDPGVDGGGVVDGVDGGVVPGRDGGGEVGADGSVVEVDGGDVDDPGDPGGSDEGCGCRAAGPVGTVPWLALAALLTATRRRAGRARRGRRS